MSSGIANIIPSMKVSRSGFLILIAARKKINFLDCFWLSFQHPVEGIRDRIYGFVQFCPKVVDVRTGKQRPKTDMAMDLSFGSIGYALVLARPFKVVCIFSISPLQPNRLPYLNLSKYSHI